ncbi:ubiquitin-like domain-containing protein [Methylobacillus flagellatus]|uniref:Uncharacterized protein n=3 Tax=root TaxID=1 RepID=Q1H2Q2_METFK|nr:ubiquitin-like domain-containing protein [Methylobacillus flagellatus]ABE49091.1 hypothetical protein Mfla_0823 [Methylobacillus flagellatus KT]ABE49235.1 hypothetical protein Mfla_0967 [Methylobacillus flagellatus KT]ABZ07151.1 hypothetical protein ALOHA_HF4000ANIW133B20ctg2g3 [uncultured marine microorganism HF4000_ANIW133B20]ABZ07577.1 hypothetical protein ALOHA_HF4000ANIW137K11ctg1g4 [uncultured marine microorganism HF4000_ANIW137K11]
MSLKLYTFKVQAGGEEIPALTGDYIRIEKALVPVRVRTENGDDFTLDEGEEANIGEFKRLILGHGGVGEEEIRLFVGTGGARVGSAKVSGGVSVPGGVNVNNLRSAVQVGNSNLVRRTITTSAGELAAVNPNRAFISIKNQDEVGTIWVSSGSVSVGNGWELGPGESIEFIGGAVFTGVLIAIGNAASNPNVMVWEGSY